MSVSLWALWFGAGFTVLTALTWLYAYNIVAHDTLSHTAMTGQRNWVIATLSLFLVIAAWAQGVEPAGQASLFEPWELQKQ